MTHRFFRSSRAVYDATRSELDRIFKHPNGKAVTSLPPAPPIERDEVAYTAIPIEMTEWQEVGPLLESLLESQAVTEITSEEYEAAAIDAGKII